MSEASVSAAEDDSGSETEAGTNDLEDDSVFVEPAPETPRTADVPTDDKISPYKLRVDNLSPGEKIWVEENIKTFETVDETDDPQGATHAHAVPGRPYSNQPSTTAFGKLHFEGEDSIGVLPSWFIRLAVNTPVDLIEELLELKLGVTRSDMYPIRIHCIDYNRWPPDEDLPQFPSSPSLFTQSDLNAVITKLQKDLCSICKKTAGIMLTWSGLGGDNVMHQVLGKIMKKSRETGEHISNLASIATPPWNAVNLDIQEKMQRAKGKNVHLKRKDDDAFVPKKRTSLGPGISQYATHFLLLDDDLATSDQVLKTDPEKFNFRHFHYEMIKALEKSEGRKTVDMPVVCMLINGRNDALKMVLHALQNHIPVLIVKESGGYADVIADVYLNCVLETIKVRDESGQVCTRITKKAGKRGKFYMDDPKTKHPLLQEIFNSLDLLTVYVPALSVQTLDSVVFEALLKNKQERKFDGLVKIMKNRRKVHQQGTFFTEKKSFIDSDDVQMNIFTEALKQNCVYAVKTFLDELEISKKFMQHFHMGRVLRLYSQNAAQGEKFIDFRKRHAKLLDMLPAIPFRCVCDGCPNCDVSTDTQSEVPELAVQRTCLHPIQELFLWTLHDCHVEMAIVFWEKCEDKIATALVARSVFKSMAKENSDPEIRWQMEENVRQFQVLAIETLRSCHSMDEMQTELLLTKPCPWWGNLSMLQLAIMTKNRQFMTQTACTNIMTLIWEGMPLSEPETERPCQLLDIPSDSCCTGRWRWCSPFLQYLANFFMQVVFLLVFTIELLFDLGQDIGNGMTYIFISLIVWVFAITLEEVRQMVSKPSVLRDSSLTWSSLTKTKFQAYFSEKWNILDVVTILFFWVGLVVFIPNPVLQDIGRVLLCIDIFLFYIRTFEMLMVFKDLGLLLVMVYKMMKDTRNFMIILLIFVLAYAVASESLLYPQSEFTGYRLFHLPRKAYWQVFGELSLEEIEIREEGSCSVNRSMHNGYDEPHCPTKLGSYVVPLLLGGHVMITNVLLLNLLIARFGVTFAKVHDEACEYQSWHRCRIIMEYYNRTSFPPPFNILYIAYYLLAKCWFKIKHCICWLCCCCRRMVGRRRRGAGAALEMTRQGQGAQNGQGSNPRGSVSGEQNPLIGRDSLKAWRSADMKSVDIVWTNELPISNPEQRGQLNPPELEVYHVKVTIKRDQQNQPTTEKYQVAKKANGEEPKEQAFTVWDMDTNAEYTISVEGVQVIPQPVQSRNPEDLWEMAEFEARQAKWVRQQQDSSMTWLKDLHAHTDTLKMEISQMSSELKGNYVALKEDTSKTNVTMKQNAKSLQKMFNNSAKRNKGNFETINNNVEKLGSFLPDIVQGMKELGKKRKEAEEKKKNTEKELQNLTKTLEKQQTEAQQSQEMMKREMTAVLQRQEALHQEEQTVMLRHLQDLQAHIQQQLQDLQEQHQAHMQQQLQDLQEQRQAQLRDLQEQRRAQLQDLQERHEAHMQQQLQDLQERHEAHMQQVLMQVVQAVKAGQASLEAADEGSGQ